jgi:hypothetical protein
VTVRAFSFDRNYEALNLELSVQSVYPMDGGWWGGIFYTCQLGQTVMLRYDSEGNALQSLNFGHNIYGIATDVEENYLFVQETGNNYAIHVYPFNEDGTVGNQIGLINNWVQYSGGYGYNCEWVHKHEDGQLWAYNYVNQRTYQIHVDTERWQADAAIQNFPVGGSQPYDNVCHDGRNMWAGGYADVTIRVYDDGVKEVNWIGVEPEGDVLGSGRDMIVVCTLNSTGLPAGEYTADIVFYSNDPSHGVPDQSYNPLFADVIIPVVLEVRGEPGIITHPAIDPLDPEVYEDYVASIEMPDTYVDNEYRMPIQIENVGNVDLTITRVEGTDEFWFDVNVDELQPIPPFEAIEIPLVFRPNDVGDREGEVHIYSDGENVQDGHLFTTVTGLGELAPVMTVHEGDIADDGFIHQQARLGAEPWDYSIFIENPAGNMRRNLDWEISLAEVEQEEQRDNAGGRTLHRTDGRAAVERDDPGDLLGTFNGFNQVNQYTSAAGYDHDLKRMWFTQYGTSTVISVSHSRDYQDFDEEVRINVPSPMDGAWWGGIFFVTQYFNNILRRYDADGNALATTNLPFTNIGLAADVENNLLFLNDNAYTIHVYEIIDEDGAIGNNQIGQINNPSQFNNGLSVYGMEWVPQHENKGGQLWMDKYNQGRMQQIHVNTDNWQADGAGINWASGAPSNSPYNGAGHDGKNMWVGGFQNADIRIYDDGVAELSWVKVNENTESGSTPAGETDEAILEFNVDELENEGIYLADMTIESNDPDNGEVVIRIELLVGAPPLRHFNDFMGSNEFHTLVIDEAIMDGMPMPIGWEIGVFADDVLAGGNVWHVVENLPVVIRAFGDDPNTEEDEGFENAQDFMFMVWDENADMEHAANFSVVDGPDVWQSGEMSHVVINGFSVREQEIDLSAESGGWNLISLNVTPGAEYQIEAGQFRGLLDPWKMVDQFGEGEESVLFLVKNEDGEFLFPSGGFSNIDFWDLAEGYYVNVREDVTGMWPGRTIPAMTPIEITEGWNMIPYYPNYNLPASSPSGFYVLSNIEDLADVVDIVKDDQGGFMVPRVPFSSMAPWRPGKGYQISVTQDVTLVYPEPQNENAAVEREGVNGEAHWVGVSRTGANMSLLINAVYGVKIAEGDQIAAFDENGNVVGTGYFDADGRAGVAVWGDNEATRSVKDGMAAGDKFTLKVWSADKGVEYDVLTGSFQRGNGLVYNENDLVALDVQATLLPTEYYIAQNFPNPFNAVTKVSFGLPEEAKVKVRVFDLTGRLVTTLVDGQLKAGHHLTVWDGQNAAAGMYLIRIESANYSRAIKAILMK